MAERVGTLGHINIKIRRVQEERNVIDINGFETWEAQCPRCKNFKRNTWALRSAHFCDVIGNRAAMLRIRKMPTAPPDFRCLKCGGGLDDPTWDKPGQTASSILAENHTRLGSQSGATLSSGMEAEGRDNGAQPKRKRVPRIDRAILLDG